MALVHNENHMLKNMVYYYFFFRRFWVKELSRSETIFRRKVLQHVP